VVAVTVKTLVAEILIPMPAEITEEVMRAVITEPEVVIVTDQEAETTGITTTGTLKNVFKSLLYCIKKPLQLRRFFYADQ
jgi:MinD-like ATPase involved in chromosome partitioning or flagellar assembly